jgi:HD-GYP domain-containing protein (c-di-GMP phosphodiesterase class II)
MHPAYARDMLSKISFLQQVLDIPYFHHEHWDGSGYPNGIKGSEIPLAARIFAVVDVWDALISDRPYRPAWSLQQAKAYIQDHSGTQFDPKVVTVFLQLLDEKTGLHNE